MKLLNSVKLKPLFLFLIGGLSNTALTYGLYLILQYYMHYQVAYAVAYVVGIFLAYYLNTKFVFNVKRSWLSFGIYPVVYLMQYAFGAILLRFFIESLMINSSVAPVLVILFNIPFSFCVNKWVLIKLQ